MKRLFDLLFSFMALLILIPLFLLIIIAILLENRPPIFFVQNRVGRYNRDFNLIKFRTMRRGSHEKGLITIGNRDQRVTKVGYFLRKYKLDELPQFINVLKGEMSIVGPRPEVRKYVESYNPDQMRVLQLRPGLTSYATIEFVNVNERLANSANPEKTYREEILPKKLELNLKYLNNRSLGNDLVIILKTFRRLLKNR